VGWHIRVAVPGDAERISFINKEALGYECPAGRTRERLDSILLRPTERVFVVCRDEDGFVAGFLHAADYETIHLGSLKNIVSLAVDGAFRGFGLGRLLLDAVEEWALASGSGGVRLVSGFDRVNAHQFYEHCGYIMRKNEKNFMKRFINAEQTL
jgi:GNAT superfamily N-acetyltransferase